MKNLKSFFTVFLLTVSGLYSQNVIDPPSINSLLVNFNNAALFAKTYNGFSSGWNYGTRGRQFDQLMNANFILQSRYWDSPVDFPNYGDSLRWFLTLVPLSTASYDSGDDMGVVSTQSIYYEPRINVVIDDSFSPTSHHTGGAFFGFQWGASKKMNEALGNTVEKFVKMKKKWTPL